jgi:hypothetical protein
MAYVVLQVAEKKSDSAPQNAGIMPKYTAYGLLHIFVEFPPSSPLSLSLSLLLVPCGYVNNQPSGQELCSYISFKQK